MLNSNFFYRIKNEWPRYLLFSLWLGGNIGGFVGIYLQYNSLQYFYLRQILFQGASVAKASGFVINLNSVLILLLVCRRLISNIRHFICCGFCNKSFCPRNVSRLLDRHVSYHRYVGYLILLFSTIHTLAHIYNAELYVHAYSLSNRIKVSNASSDFDDDEYRSLLYALSLLPGDSGKNYLNPIREPDAVPIIEAIKLIPGITGIILCIVLAIMASSSSEYIKRLFFNLFWYTHQVGAALYFIFLSFHGAQMIVRRQTNLNEHDPEKCFKFYSYWSKDGKCAIPDFQGAPPASWMYIIGPITFYLIERLLRFIRSLRKQAINGYTIHPCETLELKIANRRSDPNSINYRAGQYIFLNVSEISFFEWHPFTITSSPNNDNLTVHIRKAGDWTKKLFDKIPSIKSISVDGPIGTSAENIFKYETVVLIGAGIGITPYASILQDIWHRLRIRQNEKQTSKVGNDQNFNDPDANVLKKIYFFWVIPSIGTFEWFGELLKQLESEMINSKRTDLLDYNIYLTRWNSKDTEKIIQNNRNSTDLYIGLRQKLNYGRPNFDMFLKNLASQPNQPKKIGVFFCGLQSLSSDLHALCNKYSNEKTRFYYNKESF